MCVCVCCFLYNFYLCLKTWHSFPVAKLQHDAIDTQRRTLWTIFSLSLFFRCCCCCLSLFNFSFALILFCFISFKLLASEELPTECAATNYAPRRRSLFCSYSARHFNYLQINSAHCVYEALGPPRLPLLKTIILLLVWRYKSQD